MYAIITISTWYVIAERQKIPVTELRKTVAGGLMTVPGVGREVALTYRASVDMPARFRKSKSVGAVFGLTCSRDQSVKETARSPRVTRHRSRG